MTTGDVTPEPVTEPTDLDRILTDTAMPAEDLARALVLTPLPLEDLQEIGPGLPSLDGVTDLVDLDRVLAETAAPLQDATVVDLVAEVLGRD